MKFKLAAIAAASISLAAASAQAAIVAEVEGNDSLATAQNIDGYFTTDSDSEIFDSTTRPHATVVAGPGNGTFDFYKFTVTAGAFGLFDIDHAMFGFDSYIRLFDSAGTSLAASDDCGCLDPGTIHGFDSLLGYTFASAGTYAIRVGNYPNGTPQNGGAGYELQVSIDNHPLQGGVPEPATWAMMLIGFGGLGSLMRRRRAALAAI